MNKTPLDVIPSVDPTVESVERDLGFLMEVAKEDKWADAPLLEELSDKDYQEAIKKVDYWSFMQSADQHYFISRVLALHNIFEYSQFCGYQCIENYLKAYLKFKGSIPPRTHKLGRELLVECRNIAPESNLFIHGDYISMIIKIYEPFYELAGHPVQNKRPCKGTYVCDPEVIFTLDYFVLKMREILSIPKNTWDILRDGHFRLHQCHQTFPEFYNTFFFRNVNFSGGDTY